MSNSHMIVGLGGTGGKIIRNLRKLINSDTGHEGRGIDFEFLYFDTSEDELNKENDWRVLGTSVALGRSQYLIGKAGGIKPVLEDPASFPGLKDWIEPRHVFSFVNASTAGAAQRRKLGRIVFAQNAMKYIESVKSRVKELEARQNSAGVTFHVVCGLAGGTGSGAIVDAISLIRDAHADYEKYRILVYAFMPEENSGRVSGITGPAHYYANGYAALTELNAIATGRLHPFDVIRGGRMNYPTYFNACYLVNNKNENGVPFELSDVLPKVVAEFIYQKSLTGGWEGLGRAEKGENLDTNFEVEDGLKERAKFFMSFGIKRVVVPEEEIKEYLSYGFAEQVTRQLMFNNWQQGLGYADECRARDYHSLARDPKELQSLLISDEHLILSVGILPDDAVNTRWQKVGTYWESVVNFEKTSITTDKNLDKTNWASRLSTNLDKYFNEGYRALGGVKKFYEVKAKASPEMAKFIARNMEKRLFSRWQMGESSLMELRLQLDATLNAIEERQSSIDERINKAIAVEERSAAKRNELIGQFNGIGTLKQVLTDKRERLFDDIAQASKEHYEARTMAEGWRFGKSLISFIKDEVTQLRGNVDKLHQLLSKASEEFKKGQQTRLLDADSAYQQRLFDKDAIDSVKKSIVTDEDGQRSRIQQVRNKIIELAGVDVDSFNKIIESASLERLIQTLEEKSAEIVNVVHNEVAKSRPVVNVNIVERIQQQYDNDPEGLQKYIRSLFDEAGAMVSFDDGEVSMVVPGSSHGKQGRLQAMGVFVPRCDHRKEFRDRLARLFKDDQPTGIGDEDFQVGVSPLENQLVILRISYAMPARFISTTRYLKDKHYDVLARDDQQKYLLHGEGDGSDLPKLFASKQEERAAKSKQQPYRLIAKLLGVIKDRVNKSSGVPEWFVQYESDGFKSSVLLSGKDFDSVMTGTQLDDAQTIINKEVDKIIEKEYKLIDRKNELFNAFRTFGNEVLSSVGEDDTDPKYQAIRKMGPVIREIIGLPKTTN